MTTGTSFRPLLALVWMHCLLLLASAGPVDAVRREYNIRAGDAVVTLREFASQSGEQVIFLADQVRGIKTNAVKGALTAEQALSRLLAKTRLRALRDPSAGAWVVTRAKPAAPDLSSNQNPI